MLNLLTRKQGIARDNLLVVLNKIHTPQNGQTHTTILEQLTAILTTHPEGMAGLLEVMDRYYVVWDLPEDVQLTIQKVLAEPTFLSQSRALYCMVQKLMAFLLSAGRSGEDTESLYRRVAHTPYDEFLRLMPVCQPYDYTCA